MKRIFFLLSLVVVSSLCGPLEDLARLEADVRALSPESDDGFLSVTGEGSGEGSDALAKFVKDGALNGPKAWADADARAAILNLSMDGLVNCPVVPSSGEELARQMEYLGRWFVTNNPSASPKASLKQQAMMALLTEGTMDALSTCGYLPNLALSLSGYKGINCATQAVPLFSDKSKLKTCSLSSGSCECKVPTFNRKYIVKASAEGKPEAFDWIADPAFKQLKGKVPKPPVSQGNFKSMMTWASWTRGGVVPASLPKAGDFFFLRDAAKGEAGHVGIVMSVDKEDPFSMRTADAGATCGAPKTAKDPNGFTKSGWQCVAPKEGSRQFKKEGNYFRVNAHGKNRALEGFVSVRGLVPSDPADRAKVFDPSTRWTTKEFCDIIYKDGKATDVVPPSTKPGETGKTTGDA